MKKMIKSSSAFEPDYNKPYTLVEDDDEFIPPKFDEHFVDDVINRIRQTCKEMYSRRYPNLYVEFDDEYWGSSNESGGKMHVTVSLYSNGVEKCFGEFEFYARDSYWDESDYQQDINCAVFEFCENLV